MRNPINIAMSFHFIVDKDMWCFMKKMKKNVVPLVSLLSHICMFIILGIKNDIDFR